MEIFHYSELRSGLISLLQIKEDVVSGYWPFLWRFCRRETKPYLSTLTLINILPPGNSFQFTCLLAFFVNSNSTKSHNKIKQYQTPSQGVRICMESIEYNCYFIYQLVSRGSRTHQFLLMLLSTNNKDQQTKNLLMEIQKGRAIKSLIAISREKKRNDCNKK